MIMRELKSNTHNHTKKQIHAHARTRKNTAIQPGFAERLLVRKDVVLDVLEYCRIHMMCQMQCTMWQKGNASRNAAETTLFLSTTNTIGMKVTEACVEDEDEDEEEDEKTDVAVLSACASAQ